VAGLELRATESECVGFTDRGRPFLGCRAWRRPKTVHDSKVLLISVVASFVASNVGAWCPDLSTESALKCTDGLGEHRVPGDASTPSA
jgi:hypothetical protein